MSNATKMSQNDKNMYGDETTKLSEGLFAFGYVLLQSLFNIKILITAIWPHKRCRDGGLVSDEVLLKAVTHPFLRRFSWAHPRGSCCPRPASWSRPRRPPPLRGRRCRRGKEAPHSPQTSSSSWHKNFIEVWHLFAQVFLFSFPNLPTCGVSIFYANVKSVAV